MNCRPRHKQGLIQNFLLKLNVWECVDPFALKISLNGWYYFALCSSLLIWAPSFGAQTGIPVSERFWIHHWGKWKNLYSNLQNDSFKIFKCKHFFVLNEFQISRSAKINHLIIKELHEKLNTFQFKKICLLYMKIDFHCGGDTSFGHTFLLVSHPRHWNTGLVSKGISLTS